jgi:hypothetical protein
MWKQTTQSEFSKMTKAAQPAAIFSDPAVIRDTLIHAVTRYDRKQEGKRGHNPYALAHYFRGVDNVMDLIASGASTRTALVKCFCDRILDHCLKAINEPISTRAEQR